jgi:hypothetical protein
MKEIDAVKATLQNPAYKKTEVARVLVNSFNAKLATEEMSNVAGTLRKANNGVVDSLNSIWEERVNPKTGKEEFYLKS